MIKLEYYRSESNGRPDEIEMDSSPTTVYLRKNITTEERVEEDGSKRTVYVYDEAKLSRQDYAIYCEENNAANIDYIAMMTDVEL